MSRIASSFEGRLAQLENDFSVIRALLDLTSQGYKIHCAVDFSEVYSFAFPLTASAERWERDLEKRLNEESVLQSSLGFLFSDDRELLEPTLLMAPHHLLEMNDVLSAKARSISQLRGKTQSLYNPLLRKAVEAMGGRRRLEQLLSCCERGEEIPADALQSYFELGRRFKQVLTLMGLFSGDVAEGFEIVSNLLKNNQLRCTTEVWPELSTQLGDLTKSVARWTQKITEIRNEPRRYYSSLVDGSVLAHLEAVNRSFGDSKEILVLLTHSRSILLASKGWGAKYINGDEGLNLPFVLSPRWASVYIAHHCALGNRAEVLLRQSHDELKTILSLKKDLDARVNPRDLSSAGKHQRMTSRFVEELEMEFLVHLHETEQLAMSSQIGSFMRQEKAASLMRNKQLVRLIRALLAAYRTRQLSGEAARQAALDIERIPAYMTSIAAALTLPPLALDSLTNLESEEYTKAAHRALSKIVLKSSSATFPYTIQFRTEAAGKSFNDIVRSIQRNRYFEAYEKVGRSLVQDEITAEHYMLVAFFFASISDHASAISILGHGTSFEDGPIHELCFVQAVCHRALNELGSALTACQLAIEEKDSWRSRAKLERQRDPRYTNELAIILHRMALDAVDASQRTLLLEQALEYAQLTQAESYEDKNLTTRATNNITYICLDLLLETEDQERENQLRNNLRRLSKMARDHRRTASLTWFDEYSDTRLWATFCLAKRSQSIDSRLVNILRHEYSKLPTDEPNDPRFEDALRDHSQVVMECDSRQAGV